MIQATAAWSTSLSRHVIQGARCARGGGPRRAPAQPRAPLVAGVLGASPQVGQQELELGLEVLEERGRVDHRAVPCGVGEVARVVTSEGRVIQRLGPSGTGSPSSCGTAWLACMATSSQRAAGGVADVEQVREQATEAVAHQRPGVDDQQRPRRGEPLGPAGLHGLLHQADEVRPVAPAARPGVDAEHEGPVDLVVRGQLTGGGDEQLGDVEGIDVEPLGQVARRADVALGGCTASAPRGGAASRAAASPPRTAPSVPGSCRCWRCPGNGGWWRARRCHRGAPGPASPS